MGSDFHVVESLCYYAGNRRQGQERSQASGGAAAGVQVQGGGD